MGSLQALLWWISHISGIFFRAHNRQALSRSAGECTRGCDIMCTYGGNSEDADQEPPAETSSPWASTTEGQSARAWEARGAIQDVAQERVVLAPGAAEGKRLTAKSGGQSGLAGY